MLCVHGGCKGLGAVLCMAVSSVGQQLLGQMTNAYGILVGMMCRKPLYTTQITERCRHMSV
jgi:hypothetical protein